MAINDWWRAHPEERYWMIAPSRGVVGDALSAPKADEDRRFEWSHELVGFTEPGDTLFVWDRTLPVPGIAAWGRVLGPLGEVTRDRRGDDLPHWRMPISDTLRLATPITLPNLRRVGDEIVAVRVLADHAGHDLIVPGAWPLDEAWERWSPDPEADVPVGLPDSAEMDAARKRSGRTSLEG